jgi:putative FmdB family regulatory protein
MPVYTYRCSNCGVQFEKQQSFNDQSLLRCPECGKHALKKVYLPVGIVFKGSGFYATDHHSPSGQSGAKTEENDKPVEKKESKDKSEENKTSQDTVTGKTPENGATKSTEKKE